MGNVIGPSPSAGVQYLRWALKLAPQEDKVPTKTGKYDDSVLVGDLGKPWLDRVLAALVAKARSRKSELKTSRSLLFPRLDLAMYERLFRDARGALALQLPICPHIVRHSAASNDRFHHRRSLAEVKKRGHWQADASVARYEKAALVLASLERLTAKQKKLAREAAAAFPKRLVKALGSLP